MPPIDLHRNKIESLTMCLNSLKASSGETGPPESMWPFHVEGSLPRKDAFESKFFRLFFLGGVFFLTRACS